MKTVWLCSFSYVILPNFLACDSTRSDGHSAGASANDHSARVALDVVAPKLTDTKAMDLPGIHNVVAYGDGLHSGGAVEGDLAFETIASLGVKTIVSVDGAIPDIEAAKKQDLRYVHLPVTYWGIDEERFLEIARA